VPFAPPGQNAVAPRPVVVPVVSPGLSEFRSPLTISSAQKIGQPARALARSRYRDRINIACNEEPVEGHCTLRPVVCCGAGFQLREAVESTTSIMVSSRTQSDPPRLYSCSDLTPAHRHPMDTLAYRRIVEQELHCTSIALTVD
jgi:hypothetical protein